jgi:hypothetical protein
MAENLARIAERMREHGESPAQVPRSYKVSAMLAAALNVAAARTGSFSMRVGLHPGMAREELGHRVAFGPSTSRSCCGKTTSIASSRVSSRASRRPRPGHSVPCASSSCSTGAVGNRPRSCLVYPEPITRSSIDASNGSQRARRRTPPARDSTGLRSTSKPDTNWSTMPRDGKRSPTFGKFRTRSGMSSAVASESGGRGREGGGGMRRLGSGPRSLAKTHEDLQHSPARHRPLWTDGGDSARAIS